MEELKKAINNSNQLLIDDENIYIKSKELFEEINDYEIEDNIDTLYRFLEKIKNKVLSENSVPIKYNDIVLNVYKGAVKHLTDVNYIAKLYDLLSIEYEDTDVEVIIDKKSKSVIRSIHNDSKYEYAIALSPKTDCNIYIDKIKKLQLPEFNNIEEFTNSIKKFLFIQIKYCLLKNEGKSTREFEDLINNYLVNEYLKYLDYLDFLEHSNLYGSDDSENSFINIDKNIFKNINENDLNYLLQLDFIKINYDIFLYLLRNDLLKDKNRIEKVIIENDLREELILKNFLNTLNSSFILNNSDLILYIIDFLGEKYNVNRYNYEMNRNNFGENFVIDFMNPLKKAFNEMNNKYIEWLFENFDIDMNYTQKIGLLIEDKKIKKIYEGNKLIYEIEYEINYNIVEMKYINENIDENINIDNLDLMEIENYPIIIFGLKRKNNYEYYDIFYKYLMKKDINFEFKIDTRKKYIDENENIIELPAKYKYYKSSIILLINKIYNIFDLIYIFYGFSTPNVDIDIKKKILSIVFNNNKFKQVYLYLKMLNTKENKQSYKATNKEANKEMIDYYKKYMYPYTSLTFNDNLQFEMPFIQYLLAYDL